MKEKDLRTEKHTVDLVSLPSTRLAYFERESKCKLMEIHGI
jgi:hypothetical protein